MLYRLLASLTLVALAFSGAFAQNGAIQGTVVEDGQPAEAASVLLILRGTPINGTNTDELGNFQFDQLDAGDYLLVITYGDRRDSVPVNGVRSNETRVTGNLELNRASTGGGFTVNTVDIIGTRPLVTVDESTTGSSFGQEQIVDNPNRSIAGMAGLTPGVLVSDGGGINVRGGRSDGTEIFVDGVRVIGQSGVPQASIGSMEVITGGTPPWYGDLTSGAINITSSSPSGNYTFGGEAVTSQFLDPYGYNLFALNASGPIIQRTDTFGGIAYKRPVLSFMLAGEYESQLDRSPSAFGVPALRGGLLQDLQSRPVVMGPDNETFISRGTYINGNDIEYVKAKTNNDIREIRMNGRLDFSLGKNSVLRLGGTYNNSRYNNWSFTNSLFAPEGTTLTTQSTYRGYLRFQQSFTPDTGSIVKNIFYSLQADFTRVESEEMNENHGDNYFAYGHVGRFNNSRAELYQIVNPGDPLYNPSIGTSYFQTAGFIDTAFAFDASNSRNPLVANYNTVIYDYMRENPRDMRELVNTGLFPPFQFYDPVFTNNVVNANDLLALGGVLNGFNDNFASSTMNVYSLWTGMGQAANGYVRRRSDLFRATGQANIVIGEQERSQHTLKVGFEFDQRVQRLYVMNANRLWILARNLTNKHLANIDTSQANINYLNYGNTYLAQADPLYAGNEQSTFDRNLRQSLGLPTTGTDYINIDALDPDQMNIGMFSADELLNNGNSYATYYGYDYQGNISGTTEDGSFFSDVRNRPQDAYMPTYFAGYIHDKFQLDRIFLSLGLRVDRYDANQSVLRDPFSLVPLYKASETINYLRNQGTEVNVPGVVGDDWVAYVDDRNNPTQIVGYRDGDRWYDATGTLTSPTRLQVNGEVQPHIKSDSVGLESFSDYSPALNLLPRISFSFPINDRANFFAHYDILTQRPPAAAFLFYSDYLFIEQSATNSINNPALRPERTIDYEVGFNQLLDPQGRLALKVSAYYREMRDMVQVVRNTAAYPITYDSYANLDFATVKGFSLELITQRIGVLRTNLAYTLQFAEGTGSSFTSSRAALNGVEGFTVLRTLLPLSFDQRHTFTGNVDIRWEDIPGGASRKGPKIGNFYPLRNFGASLTFNMGSGTPFSRNALPNQADVQYGVNSTSQVRGTAFGSRLPFNFRMDLRINREFYIKFAGRQTGESTDGAPPINSRERGLSLDVYMVFLNILGTQNIQGVYQYSGQPDNSGFLESAQGDVAIQSYGIDRQAFVDQFRVKERTPDNYSLPRRIRLGLLLSF